MSQGGHTRRARRSRTRQALVEAARQLAGANARVNVAQAADAAGVSRATAYRYFSSQEALDVELETDNVWQDVDALLERIEPGDIRHTLDQLVAEISATVRRHEAHVRTMLRVIHDTWLRGRSKQDGPLRRGRRQDWIYRVTKAGPTLPDATDKRLRAALALVVAPDAIIHLGDALGIDDAEVTLTVQWAAQALLSAALQEANVSAPVRD